MPGVLKQTNTDLGIVLVGFYLTLMGHNTKTTFTIFSHVRVCNLFPSLTHEVADRVVVMAKTSQ